MDQIGQSTADHVSFETFLPLTIQQGSESGLVAINKNGEQVFVN
jgi:hypothetical protein